MSESDAERSTTDAPVPSNINKRRRTGKLVLVIVLAAASLTWLGFQSRSFIQHYKAHAGAEERIRRISEAMRDTGRPLEALFNLNNLDIPRDHIAKGGPPKDGIPALTDPKVVSLTKVDWPEDGRVVGVELNGEARAYPIGILARHEVVNDTLGGVPIAVTYCPLCDSISIFDRRLNNETYEFGVSGLLYNSNVLMFDRTDEALWSQVDFQAISGPHAGESLRHLDGWQLTTLEVWRTSKPDSTILSRETGYDTPYEQTLYADYFENDELLFPVTHEDDRIALNKTPIVGVSFGDVQRAYPLSAIRQSDNGTLVDHIRGETIRLRAENASSLRIIEVPENAKVAHTFWFAWAAMHPDTEIYGSD